MAVRGYNATVDERENVLVRRGRVVLLALSIAVASYPAWQPAPVVFAALGCIGPGPSGQSFAGNSFTHTNDVEGARARIEYVNEQLCTTSGDPDFSSYWAAVVGDPGGYNIYQVGVDKCRGGACPAGVPVNQSYYFTAYGRNAGGPCGAAVGPEPRAAPLGNAGNGTRTYTAIKTYTPGAGWFWSLYIDGALQDTQPASNLDTCWGGVDRVDFFNEVWDRNAQSGGSVGNKQTFSAVSWNDDGTWISVPGSGGANCQYRQLSTMRCVWQYGSPAWDSWDTRWE